VELKSVQKADPAHKKQVRTDFRVSGMKRGYLLNFGQTEMNHGGTQIIRGE
jgi:GxxExxY protein